MQKVAIHAPWADDDHIFRVWSRYLPASNSWGGIQFVHRSEPHDWLIVFNYPNIAFDPRKTLLYQHEPTPLRNTWPAPWNDPAESAVRGCYTIPRLYMPYHWYELYDKDWDWLTSNPVNKTKDVSAVISDKLFFEGSRDRMAFVQQHLEHITPQVDLFGRCVQPPSKCYRGEIADKSEALLPYKYTIACENSYEPNYFTEKLIDGIVSECVTFYSGCPNVDKFFNPHSYIKINIKEPRAAVEFINEQIANNAYKYHIEAVRDEKHRILHEKHFFAMLDRHIHQLSR